MLINGFIVYVFDFDDVYFDVRGYLSVVIFLVLIAVVLLGCIDKSCFFGVYVIGIEVMVWFGELLGRFYYEKGWYNMGMLGVIVVVCVVGFVENLNYY